jgi:hypothetical protein
VIQVLCSHVVTLSGVLGERQSLALGIYTIASQRLAKNPRPVYVKLGENASHHVYYR